MASGGSNSSPWTPPVISKCGPPCDPSITVVRSASDMSRRGVQPAHGQGTEPRRDAARLTVRYVIGQQHLATIKSHTRIRESLLHVLFQVPLMLPCAAAVGRDGRRQRRAFP